MGKRLRGLFNNPILYVLAVFSIAFSSAQAAPAEPARADAPKAVAVPAGVSAKVAELFPPGAEYVGDERCMSCHTVENDKFSHTAHAKAFRLNPKNELQRRGCEACHGPGSRHANENYMDKSLLISFTRESVKGEEAKIGENQKDKSLIIGFTREGNKPGEKSAGGKGSPQERLNSVCLQCHDGGQRIFWKSSTHQTSGLTCSDCHNPMAKFSQNGLQKTASISETCYTCHQQQRMEFRKRSHMPLPEGKMSCADCHNPHGSQTKPLLKADTVNQLCYNCHQEKRGPFLWEHAPVRESCLNCHSPHGSNQEKLLSTARPMLCQQCHTHTTHQNNLLTKANTPSGSLPDERVIARGCSTCHAQVHGSNHPAGARLHR